MHSDAASLLAIPHISVTPENALIDDKLYIRVSGLQKYQNVTLLNKVADNGIRFASSGCFRANNEGIVDVSQDECLQGTYKGKDAMGLFWSLKPEPGYENKRLLKDDVSTPLVFHVLVYDGMYSWEELHKKSSTLEPLNSTEINRWYKSPDVKRIDIHEGNLRGALFIPKGTGPFPAIIDMFGGIGGLVETRAALFASRGFLTLALAYFNYKDLPVNFYDVHYPYFLEAASWMYNHPLALPGGIGTVGVSYGGVFSASMATFLKEAWESDAKYLCLVGEDDQCLDSSYMDYWYSKWPSDQRHKVEYIKYPDTGHLVEPPYSPLHRTTTIRTPFKGLCFWGGTPEGHAHAQEDSWRRILDFLHTNVPVKSKQTIKSQL
ncbi:hypothetical protein FSP39_001301 [Pinctada imbricata]|uniref:Uncharacterized protein n=1 Tax=Pinctada imbricata TaxID=66713 RepID=A0AA89C629_PINIB|nr:hypothetical protein FSP39_001301 [Pinctada imbricata]